MAQIILFIEIQQEKEKIHVFRTKRQFYTFAFIATDCCGLVSHGYVTLLEVTEKICRLSGTAKFIVLTMLKTRNAFKNDESQLKSAYG